MGRVSPAAETAGCPIVGEDDDDDDDDNDDDDGDGRPDDDDEDDTISLPPPRSGLSVLWRTSKEPSEAAHIAVWPWVRVTHPTLKLVSMMLMIMMLMMIIIMLN